MLADEVHDGDRVRARWDAAARRLVLQPSRPGGETQEGARPRRKAAKPNGAPADEPVRPESRPAADDVQPAA